MKKEYKMTKYQKLQMEYHNQGLDITYSRYYGAYLITPTNKRKCLENKGTSTLFTFLKVYDKDDAYDLPYILEMIKADHPEWL